jgi:hypothetical protein
MQQTSTVLRQAPEHAQINATSRSTPSQHPWARWIMAGPVGIGLIVRLRLVFGSATTSQDLIRSILSGRAVWEKGLATAGRPLLETFPTATLENGVPWGQNPYNYPPVAVAFFTLIAALGGGPLLAKLLLTLCDAVSSVLIGRITKRPWLGAAFWMSPISMWWSSHEGQFEGLQTALGLGAVAAMGTPFLCGVLFALAVQTKMTALALGPYFAFEMYKRKGLTKFTTGSALGLIPTVAFSVVYPVIPNIFKYSSEFRWNPYFWNTSDRSQTWSGSAFLGRIVPQIVSYLLLIGVLFMMVRTRNALAATPALIYVAAMKFHVVFPGWYFLTLMLVLVPLLRSNAPMSRPTRRVGVVLFGLCVVAETTGFSAFAVWCLS